RTPVTYRRAAARRGSTCTGLARVSFSPTPLVPSGGAQFRQMTKARTARPRTYLRTFRMTRLFTGWPLVERQNCPGHEGVARVLPEHAVIRPGICPVEISDNRRQTGRRRSLEKKLTALRGSDNLRSRKEFPKGPWRNWERARMAF